MYYLCNYTSSAQHERQMQGRGSEGMLPFHILPYRKKFPRRPRLDVRAAWREECVQRRGRVIHLDDVMT